MKKGIIVSGQIMVLLAAVPVMAEDSGGASNDQAQPGLSNKYPPLLLARNSDDSVGGTGRQDDDNALYRDTEFSVDVFGGGTLNEHDVDRISGERIHHNGRLGLGAGGTFFFLRNVGISGEAYSENPHPKLVNEASGSLVLRFPLGESGFSPYIFGGGGHQFEPQSATLAHGGGGLEFRFCPTFGVFADARWVTTDNIGNYGMARAGFRIAF